MGTFLVLSVIIMIASAVAESGKSVKDILKNVEE